MIATMQEFEARNQENKMEGGRNKSVKLDARMTK